MVRRSNPRSSRSLDAVCSSWAAIDVVSDWPPSSSPEREIPRIVRRRRPRIEDRDAFTTIRPNQAGNSSACRSDGGAATSGRRWPAWCPAPRTHRRGLPGRSERSDPGGRRQDSRRRRDRLGGLARPASARVVRRCTHGRVLQAIDRREGPHDRQDAHRAVMVIAIVGRNDKGQQLMDSADVVMKRRAVRRFKDGGVPRGRSRGSHGWRSARRRRGSARASGSSS